MGSKDGEGKDLVNGVPMKTYERNISLGFVASLAFMGAFTWLVVEEKVILSGLVRPEKLTGYGLRAEFVFRYLILGVWWLLFAIMAVISKRANSPALDPMNKSEHLTEANKNILTNSLEQFVLSAVTQLSIISYMSSEEVIKVIPLLNFLFFAGRVTFFMGYPRYRSFGFFTTVLPTFCAASYGLYKFGRHLGVY